MQELIFSSLEANALTKSLSEYFGNMWVWWQSAFDRVMAGQLLGVRFLR